MVKAFARLRSLANLTQFAMCTYIFAKLPWSRDSQVDFYGS